MSKTNTMPGAKRKALLLDIGTKLVVKYGAVNVTRSMVAKAGKVSAGLVTAYFGNIGEARKAYAKNAKKLGLPQPDKGQQVALGIKLRKHAPKDKRDTRPRTMTEVKAITKKRKPTAAVSRKVKVVTPPETKPAREPRKPAIKPPSAFLPKLPPLNFG